MAGSGMGQLPERVYIIDDDPTTCRYFEALLTSDGYRCGVLHSPQDFLDSYHHQEPGCVLLDVRLPEMSGPQLQQKLNRMGAVIPIIFVTAHADVPMAVEAMREGAFGVLEKPVSNDQLLSTVRSAVESDRELRQKLRAREQILERFRSLTSRENDVLLGLLAGGTNKVLAGDLNLSQRTIELHRSRIMEKLGTRSLAQLARMAMDAGFIPPNLT
jgi:two-component system, LuxR family, response regulator FixJ